MYTNGQVYTNGMGFDFFYPMKTKTSSECARTLTLFMSETGIPQTLITDMAPELTSGEYRDVCNKHRVKRMTTVPYSPWRNLAEACVRELKTNMRRIMRCRKVPKQLWCYATQHAAALRHFYRA